MIKGIFIIFIVISLIHCFSKADYYNSILVNCSATHTNRSQNLSHFAAHAVYKFWHNHSNYKFININWVLIIKESIKKFSLSYKIQQTVYLSYLRSLLFSTFIRSSCSSYRITWYRPFKSIRFKIANSFYISFWTCLMELLDPFELLF